MLKHLYKLIWNKKRQNSLLLLEIFISFMVVFILFSFVVYYYDNYRRPYGFEFENVLSISFLKNTIYSDTASTTTADSLTCETLRKRLKAIPGIVELTFSSVNIPYAFSNNTGEYEYKKVKAKANYYDAEDSYPNVMGIKLLEGRWFSKDDDAAKDKPIVITQSLKEKLFNSETAIGKLLWEGQIVGVINDIRDKDDFNEIESGLFRRLNLADNSILRILVRVEPGSKKVIENRIYQALSDDQLITNAEMEFLSIKKARKNKVKLIPMVLMLIVSTFLIINVSLGLFGVLWYNISQRRAEIGLRRAIGASEMSVTRQLIAEALIMATLALILGSFFAIQFPLLHIFDLPASTYLIALSLAIIFIYLLVTLCALYPGRQAATIHPAVALHED